MRKLGWILALIANNVFVIGQETGNKVDSVILLKNDTVVFHQKDSLIKDKETKDTTPPVKIAGLPLKMDNPDVSKYDKIITVNNETLIVSIKSSSELMVSFVYPLNTYEYKLNRTEMKEIIYADGTRVKILQPNMAGKLYTPDEVSIQSETDWNWVLVSSNPSLAANLKEKGKIFSKSEGDKINTSADLLEKNAIIILQKKAARLKGYMVVITDKKVNIEYGELPSVQLKGTVYSY